jgi:hypothetical protein
MALKEFHSLRSQVNELSKDIENGIHDVFNGVRKCNCYVSITDSLW